MIRTKHNNTMKEVGFIKANLLPIEYQEVEYIESTGKQEIDTGFKPNQDTRIILDFDISEYQNFKDILVCRETDKNFYLTFGNGNNYQLGYGNANLSNVFWRYQR